MSEVSICADNVLKKKKMLILICGTIIFFFTSMSKVIIPSTIFQDLLQSGMAVDRISSFGSSFMFAYAASEIMIGCFSDRYGGVRILLIGGSIFTVGTIGFPAFENYYLMLLFRIVTGFGAGTIFVGVAKLLADLFTRGFGLALGIVLVFSYLGPTTGTVPMVKLVEGIGWKFAMLLPGCISLLALLVIICLAKGTIKPVTSGQTLGPLYAMLKSRGMWFLCFAGACIYGVYYVFLSQVGQKTLTDVFSLTGGKAASWLMALTILVAANNMTVNGLMKLFGEKRKPVMILGILLTLAGSLLGWYCFRYGEGLPVFLVSAFVIAFPAGFFSLMGTIAKEMFPPELTGMALSYLNFTIFVFIALYQDITGRIMKAFPPAPGSIVFPPETYSAIYLFFIIGSIISLVSVLFVPETGTRNKQ